MQEFEHLFPRAHVFQWFALSDQESKFKRYLTHNDILKINQIKVTFRKMLIKLKTPVRLSSIHMCYSLFFSNAVLLLWIMRE